MKDLYEILGLSSSADTADIKKAFRKLARERHPDSDPSNPRAEEEFKELSQAYDILSNPKTRAQYDRGEMGANRAERQRTYSTGTRRSTETSGRGRKSKRSVKVNGADVEYDLKISFMDAAKGGVKHISMTNGKRLKVNIPQGVGNGTLLRLKGQGIPGIGGGRDGDALVLVAVLPDPTFRREETDIHVDLPVSLPEAVLGARVDAPTIDGPVSVTVPPKSNTGTILRLKGKGLPTGKDGKGGRGDQYVTLKVVLPRQPDKDFLDFVEKWAPAHGYNVRPKS